MMTEAAVFECYNETRTLGLWLLGLSVSIIQFLLRKLALTLEKQKPQNG